MGAVGREKWTPGAFGGSVAILLLLVLLIGALPFTDGGTAPALANSSSATNADSLGTPTVAVAAAFATVGIGIGTKPCGVGIMPGGHPVEVLFPGPLLLFFPTAELGAGEFDLEMSEESALSSRSLSFCNR